MPRGVTLGPRFRDGLGVRVAEVEKTSGDTVEVLYLCPDLCPFEKAIKDRSDQLSNFRHPRFVPVRGVRAASGPHGRVGVIADHIVGPRVSEVLEAARQEKLAVDINAALHLIRELLSAITAFHESRKVTHGAIGPERLIVTPRGRLVVVDYVLGPGLERLQYDGTRLWRDFRIAMPPTAGAARFDQRADVNQIGTVAVALLIGRPLDTSDYPGRLEELLDGAAEVTVNGDRKPLSPALRSWLERVLPLEARKPFGTARQANLALEQILIKERRPGVAPAALRAFISRYLSSTAGRATEAHEATTDQLVRSAAETRTGDGGDEPAPLPEKRDVPSLTSAVIEADPEVAGPFAATPLEIVPDAAPAPGPRVGSEIIPEVAPGIIPEDAAGAASGISAAIGSDITVEVTSGIDAEFTVEIASGIVEATTVERPLEVGSGREPDIATADAAESWAPARETVGPAEVPGITGFDADSGRTLALEAELGVASKPPEPSSAAAETLADLQMPSPTTAAVSLPVRGETASRPGELLPSPREGLHERGAEQREPAAGAASDDVWVIDPSDLTFDPAFLDGLYQPLRADPGPLVPEPPGKVGAEPAVKPLPAAVAHTQIPPVRRDSEDVPSPPEVRPVAAAEEADSFAEPAAGAADVAPVAEAVAAPVTEAVSAPVALPADVIVAGAITEVAAQASAEAATGVVAAAVTEVAAEPVPEPVAEAVPPEESPDVPEPPAAAAPPAPSAAPVLEPLEVLPALDASWPFVQESPTRVADLVTKLAPKEELTSVDTDASRLARLPSASLRPGKPRPTIGGSASVAAPLGEAMPPAASVTPELEPLEVLPALDANWPFVQESSEPFADLLVKRVSRPPAAPVAARAAAAGAEPVGPPPDATSVAESVPAPAAAAVAEPIEELLAEAVPELVAKPIRETIAPQKPTGVAAPPPGEEPSPAVLASDTPGVASPHAATTVQEGSGVREAVKVFERLLESLQDTAAAQTVTVLPKASDASSDGAAETPAGTTALATAPAESACDQASPHDQLFGSVGPHVPIFEAPRVGGGPAVSSPPEEAPPTPAPSRPVMFAVRGTAARLARSVPTRLVDLSRTRLRWRQAAAAALVVVALGGVRLATAYWFKAPPPTGDLIVETVPDGLDVFVDNALRGQTPMSVTLPAGDHVLEVRGKGLTRTLPVRIAPGIKAEERLSWPLSARTGRLRVESEPSKANVSVDGQPRGVTPLTIEDLPARVHTLVVQGRGGRVERSVTIDPEQTTAVKVPVFPGWMKVFSPFDLQIFEAGRLLANTDVDRVMLRAGRHTIEFVNEELGYRVVRQVDITPGALTPVSMAPATGTLEIDAPPGFEVWLDGERVGETPLAALQVPLGTHDVRLRHPQSGERRRTVVVTQREPARVTAEGK